MPPATLATAETDADRGTDTARAPAGGTIREEECPNCEVALPHRVTVEIRAGDSEAATRRGTEKYSRGPYRVAECLGCERSRTTRIDNR